MKSKLPFLRAVFFSFITITLLFFLFFPFLCDRYLLPHLISKLPFSQKEVSLSRISPWKIRGTLRISEAGELVASIPKFELHYSPLSLLRGRLDTLFIDGATLQLTQNNNTLSFAGNTARPATQDSNNTSFIRPLPYIIDKVVVRDSRLRLQHAARSTDFLLDGILRLDSTRQAHQYIPTKLSLDINTTGTFNLSSTITATLSEEEIHIATRLNLPNLRELGQLIPDKEAMIPEGKLSSTGEVSVHSKTLEIQGYNFNTVIKDAQASIDDFKVGQTEHNTPIMLAVSGDKNELRYNISNLLLQAPQLQIHCKADGKVDLTNRRFDIQSSLYSPQFNNPFELSGSGSFSAQSLAADLFLNSDSFSIDKNSTIGPVALKSNISFENKTLQTKITGTIATAKLNSLQLAAKDIRLDVSFRYPHQEPKLQQKSTITIDSLLYKNTKTAKLSAHFTQKQGGIDFRSKLTSELEIPGDVNCTGNMEFNGTATAHCTLLPTSFDSGKLPDYLTLPEATSLTGIVSADANIAFKKNSPSGNLKLSLDKGSLQSGETSVTDIDTTLDFPNLPSLMSAPGQLVTIGPINSGKIHLDGGKLFFRIENKEQVFLEKARFSWCGGKIETGSLTLHTSMDDFEATLYCDRLGFAELLQQFGIEGTDGEGSLNGRLPVAFHKGKVFFDDGFLFSTPGNSGIVRFSDTEQLRQGVPDMGQSGTLDYSIKALENFAYNWTKLTFNTEGENLLLALQLDGGPAEPLPFRYKNGQIIATKKGAGLQHPIRLDMNFRLPLQDLFQYGRSLQSIMENM